MNKVNIYNTKGAGVASGLFSVRGGWSIKTGLSKVEEDIRMLLMTSKGTFIGDPEYGSNLYKMLYYGNTTSTASRVRFEIQEVMEKYMPQINVDNIDVEFVTNTMRLYLTYSIQYTNVNQDMTLEFIKGEGGLPV